MFKKILTFLFLAALGVIIYRYFPLTKPTVFLVDESSDNYFVAPDGSDASTGSVAQPFQTITKARDVVRSKIAGGLNKPVNVYLRGGTYTLDAPLEFNIADSGTDQYSVTYQSYPGETAVLSGGSLLPKNWVTESGSIWKLAVGEARFRSLFKNNTRLYPARFPDPGSFLRVKALDNTRTEFAFDRPLPTTSLTGADMISLYNWETSITPLGMGSACCVKTAAPVGVASIAGGQLSPKVGDAVYLENSSAFLNLPGEWSLDTITSTLYYYAENGENPNDAQFVIPRLTSLVRIQGTGSEVVNNLHFRNLTFSYSDWEIPSSGYDGLQANFRLTTKDSPASAPLPGSLYISNARNLSFSSNTVSHLGMGGLAIGENTRNLTLDRNNLTDIGGNCLDLGWSATKGYHKPWPTAESVPDNLTVSNNRLTGCAQIFFGGVGISGAGFKNSEITHNEISRMPYSGISILTAVNNQGNLAITHNKIHDVMKLLSDGGGIYTTGTMPGSSIEANLIYDIRSAGIVESRNLINSGIYLDQQTQSYTITNNIVYNSQGSNFFTNETNLADNNISNNYFGVDPNSGSFPTALANQAGPLPGGTLSVPPSPTPSPATIPSQEPSAIPSPVASSSTKPGDLNSDGQVNLLDYNLLISKFGNPYTLLDYNALVANFNK